MSLQRPRRIFHGSRPAPARRLPWRAILLGIAGLALAGGVARLAAFGASGLLHGQPPTAIRTVSAPAGAVSVVGGDTLLLGRTVVRLQGIEAPERGTACRSGAAGLDCGAAATAALAGLVRDRAVSCRLADADAAGRPFGDCTASGPPGEPVELSRAMVGAGWARPTTGAPDLRAAEAAARAAGRGQWGAE